MGATEDRYAAADRLSRVVVNVLDYHVSMRNPLPEWAWRELAPLAWEYEQAHKRAQAEATR